MRSRLLPQAHAEAPHTRREELRAELSSRLGWCLPVGAISGLLLGAVLLTTGPVPGYFAGGLTFVTIWGLLGVCGGLTVAGLRLLAR